MVVSASTFAHVVNDHLLIDLHNFSNSIYSTTGSTASECDEEGKRLGCGGKGTAGQTQGAGEVVFQVEVSADIIQDPEYEERGAEQSTNDPPRENLKNCKDRRRTKDNTVGATVNLWSVLFSNCFLPVS